MAAMNVPADDVWWQAANEQEVRFRRHIALLAGVLSGMNIATRTLPL